MFRFIIAVILEIGIITPKSALCSENWLIGYWEGTVSSDGFLRELRIREIRPDGTFNGLWAFHGYVANSVSGRLENETIKLKLTNGSSVGAVAILAHGGSDLLIGVGNQPGGATSQIVLTRKSTEWNHSTVSGGGCDYESYTASVPHQRDGIKHLAEGQTAHDVRSSDTLICKDGVYQRVLQ